MRILLVTPYFYPHKGGSQQYALELHAFLMEADPKIKVDVLCYNTDNALAVEKYRGMTIYRIPCLQILPGQFALPNYFVLAKTIHSLFKKKKYRFINSHTRFFESSWWVPFVAKYFNTKSVLTDHCANHPTHPSQLVNGIAAAVDKLWIPFITRLYDVITVTNQATYDFTINLGMKIPVLIYGGVDTTSFKPAPKAIKRTIPGINRTFSTSDTLVTFVGRMIPSKGPQLLFQTAKNITKQYPRVSFIFAGNGKMYDQLASQGNKQIIFLGSREQKQVAELLSKSNILVHPSLHHEGFPNVLAEAGASGCAVIATDMGGSREIILDGKTGLIVKPQVKSIQKALETLLKDKKKQRKLGQNARIWIKQQYDWKKIVKDYRKLIEQRIITNK